MLCRICKRKKTTLKKGWFVDPQGFEPQMTEPKSVVLPLHHESVFLCREIIEIISKIKMILKD